MTLTAQTPALGPGALGRGADADLVAAARRLLESLRAQPDGQVSHSVYETGRVVSLAPWLTGHAERISYLLAEERAGRWGGPNGYGLVPTLSVTEALLTVARRAVDGRASTRAERLPSHVDISQVVAAARRGIMTLRAWLRGPGLDLPDTPALDIIAPALVEGINAHLTRLAGSPLPGFPAGSRPRPLPSPASLGSGRLARVRAAVAAGHAVPRKLVHALEVLGDTARRAPGVAPAEGGTVGASPAATAAWLGTTRPGPGPSRSHLEALVATTGGPVPCGLPITAFERSWVIGDLGRGGLLAPSRPRDIVTSLAAALRRDGVPGGPGLPADADTTSATLHALALAGRPRPVTPLWTFETPTHFCTWPGEDGASPTVNAHVLEALVTSGSEAGASAGRREAAVDRVAHWLIEQQQPDGSWSDRWHASPFYATRCCTGALSAATATASRSLARACRAAIRGAARWVLDTRREDGGWGIWGGTAEETAYALMTIVEAGELPGARRAVATGSSYLDDRVAAGGMEHEPALWHDKDLYRPHAIVQAAVLAALRLARTIPRGASPGGPPPRYVRNRARPA